MARMSIDDSVLRDPRVDELAEAVGWSRRETLGALLDVWAICYDRVSCVLTLKEVDRTARKAGFAEQMVAAGLAKGVRGDANQVRVSGVEDRIGYLEGARESGRKGGVKSGESRRRRSEGTLREETKAPFAEPEGSANPSALPSALPSASAVPSVPDREREPSRPIPSADTRRREADVVWRQHQAEREAVGREVGEKAPVLASTDQSWKELLERIREAVVDGGETLETALDRCRYVISVAASEARRDRTLKWFGGRIWHKKNFDELAGRPLATTQQRAQIAVLDLSRDEHANPFERDIAPMIPEHVYALLDQQAKE